jgi:hypothetical protein
MLEPSGGQEVGSLEAIASLVFVDLDDEPMVLPRVSDQFGAPLRIHVQVKVSVGSAAA